ncbi:hypothetical protein GCM10008918_21200 [Lactobacillus kefiranofaciens subsp. kefiranofaciens]|uniref:Nicotinate phosphoribosyltransferase n=1 Tax=Lactobacillus kefiranofaciens TaxID=267818 RepID=A0ABY0MF02_9LACO|nr:nicotinate phosphoribosyltransferase [Lactobacillus kefiranofaciens subsp. kefiranofaciens DSM 5016 = JCM 6985]SDA51596.1 nicotinate phosphoribosyltransferase [Lactobacillus kefiranofaciens]
MFYPELDKDDSLALHTDLYEINMMYTYFKKGIADRNAVFETFYRQEPFGNGYAVYAGLEHVIRYLKNLKFKESDLQYLKEQEGYDDDFIDYLRNLQLKLTIRSMKEGELVFANEPILQVEGPLAQCQLVETAILNIINFQTLLATKAARIKLAVQDDSLMEFGSRRAQETDAAIWGARAAYIGGFDSTSNVRAGKLFGIPISGTHAHALVEAFGSEYEAFKAYAETHKDCVFLVDTYDTVRSGVPNAIRVANEMGDKINFLGVRIDSGDMAYMSKQVRKELDDAGYPNAKIFASNDLDENTITNLKMQGAKIDVWGIGTKYITAYDQPALGAVYKLVAMEDEVHAMRDTLKISLMPLRFQLQARSKYGGLARTPLRRMKAIGYLAIMKIHVSLMPCSCSTHNIPISIRWLRITLRFRFYTIFLRMVNWFTNSQVWTRLKSFVSKILMACGMNISVA